MQFFANSLESLFGLHLIEALDGVLDRRLRNTTRRGTKPGLKQIFEHLQTVKLFVKCEGSTSVSLFQRWKKLLQPQQKIQNAADALQSVASLTCAPVTYTACVTTRSSKSLTPVQD
ncbi:hypothetical protein AV530_007857 [Patagioenas fasciata monilis]|uniref:Uncharacterized protein n=1 Tax=Patagioenas fasciata monilis TaxID=372326 RepID=A0A1V4JT61_PATFA|nr:hypothetical protein AV530_007857 [Patagioenas fasciata monilis]